MSQKIHPYSSVSQRFGTTSDLEILKDEAKQLNTGRHANSQAIAETTALLRDTALNYSQCLEALAKYYDYSSYYEFCREQSLFLKYCSFNQLNGIWRGPNGLKWRRHIFNRQCSALLSAAEKNIPVAEEAERLNITFENFHFSQFLYKKLYTKRVRLDFSGIEATGCYLEQRWSDAITSLRGAKLAYAKFYKIYADGEIGPGIHYWRLNASSADLSGADLRESYLRSSSFYRANLHGADLRNANIFDCIFDGSKGFCILGDENSDTTINWLAVPKGLY